MRGKMEARAEGMPSLFEGAGRRSTDDVGLFQWSCTADNLSTVGDTVKGVLIATLSNSRYGVGSYPGLVRRGNALGDHWK